MNTLNYILDHYQRMDMQKNAGGRAVLTALVHTLTKEELQTLRKKIKRNVLNWHVSTELCKEVTKVLNKKYPHRNGDISTVLKQFSDKKSGKVTEARVELRDRYSKQSFQMQRKILKAMLAASKQDRIWAYKQLEKAWDDYFFEDVKKLWEQHREEACIAVVSKHFPTDYVYDNLPWLDKNDNYFYLCVKLVHHPSFKIDARRFINTSHTWWWPDLAYLHIMAKSKSKVEPGVATKVLYKYMAFYIQNTTLPPRAPFQYDLSDQIHDKTLSTRYFEFVSFTLWCMGELGLVEELLAYEAWDNKIKSLFFKHIWEGLIISVEPENTSRHSWDYEDLQGMWDLFRYTIVECLPEEYQQLIKVKFKASVDPESRLIPNQQEAPIAIPTGQDSDPMRQTEVLNKLIAEFNLEELPFK
ncbi:MAG: hypothetical protein K6F98_07940 [Bacteroidales bacterium]|nr:hypothetical protein [Bacteroidales bacterium]